MKKPTIASLTARVIELEATVEKLRGKITKQPVREGFLARARRLKHNALKTMSRIQFQVPVKLS